MKQDPNFTYNLIINIAPKLFIAILGVLSYLIIFT